MLQGQQRFVAFGLTRTAFAVGRLVVAVILIGMAGTGGLGGVAALPLGAVVALAAGLMWLGRKVWQRGSRVPRVVIWEGWRLSLGALLAYSAYMSLLNLDLIWVNRVFPAEMAGSYATAVVLRRVLSLLPGAVLVILYPRIVERVARGELPDRALLKSLLVIAGTTLSLTALYFLFGSPIVRLLFGPDYPGAGALLGWMGVAMIGYGIAAIWLNLYLATTAGPFVALLAGTAVLQYVLYGTIHDSLRGMTLLFGIGGWLPALGGLVLYVLWLRPRLVARQA
jgi:O-antigen/teichoic acid export membrane protein